MKRFIALLLATIMCLTLAACGTDEAKENESVSNEDILSSAEEITAEQLWSDIGGNAAKAETYVGKALKITGTVIEIEKDNCYIMSHANENSTINHFEDGVQFDAEFGIRAYLGAERLAELNIGDVITFTGVLDSTGNEEYGIANAIVLYFNNAVAAN